MPPTCPVPFPPTDLPVTTPADVSITGDPLWEVTVAHSDHFRKYILTVSGKWRLCGWAVSVMPPELIDGTI